MPSTLAANPSAAIPEPVPAAPFVVPFAPWLPVPEPAEGPAGPSGHAPLTPAVGDVPADPFAPKHADPAGAPDPPLPSDRLAPKSSEAEVACVPQAVARLTSVGTPGEASAIEQVEAFVGS
jgi:hypothetical protein